MDKERIYNGFPQILLNDVRAAISVLPFHNDVRQNDGQITLLFLIFSHS